MELFEIFGHTIDFRGSGTGSLDPWSADYAYGQGVSMMCTADMASFALIDGERVFRIKHGLIPLYNELKEALENDKVASWDDAFAIFSKYIDREFEPLSKSKHGIDIMKMHSEKFEKLTKKEKEAYWDKWRKERDMVRNMSEEERKTFLEEKQRKEEEEFKKWIKQKENEKESDENI